MNNDEKIDINRATTDLLIKRIKEKTKTNAIKINETEAGNLSIFDSKFGGLPYWDESMEYPTDEDGNALVLLAQINFEKTPLYDERFPRKGILQFFIGTDDIMGADFDNLNSQKGSRVIYHENINEKLTKEDIRAQGIRANTDLDGASDEYFPFYKQYEITFDNVEDIISSSTQGFDKIVRDTVKEVLNCDIDNFWSAFPDEEADYFNDAFYKCGHKLLGYPFFTQWDPRDENCVYKGTKYDILLLQVDSEGDILWGDSGVGNFFINEQDLRNRDFSKVLYTWDCY